MKLLFIAFTLISTFGFTQLNFEYTYTFGDYHSPIHSIYETDSCYYFGAYSGSNGGTKDNVFGKLDLQGNVEFYQIEATPQTLDWSRWSRTDISPNWRDNFVFGYIQADSAYQFSNLVIKEFNPQGELELEFLIDDFIVEDVRFSGLPTMISHDFDSSYYFACTYSDTTPTFPSIYETSETGTMLIKINTQGDVVWNHRIFNTSNSQQHPRHDPLEFKNDSVLRLSVRKFEFREHWYDNQTWGGIHYYEFTTDGVELDHFDFEDGDYIYGESGTLWLDDSTVIQSYYDSKEFNPDAAWSKYRERAILARINTQGEILWKDSLKIDYSDYDNWSASSRLKWVSDSVFAGAYCWYFREDSVSLLTTVRVFNRHVDGTLLWQRDYSPIENSPAYQVQYEIIDFDVTSDGGFLLSGMKRIKPGGNHIDEGYVLKTNCLGYLGHPVAGATYVENNDLTVTFYNTSTQSGNCHLEFGDGFSVSLPESWDSITHVYLNAGDYNATLTVYGCNEAFDQVDFKLSVIGANDSTTTIDVGNGNLAIYPNPLNEGQPLYTFITGLETLDDVPVLSVVSIQGAKVYDIVLPQENGNYSLDLNLNSGIYFVKLYVGGQEIRSRKLVVR